MSKIVISILVLSVLPHGIIVFWELPNTPKSLDLQEFMVSKMDSVTSVFTFPVNFFLL